MPPTAAFPRGARQVPVIALSLGQAGAQLAAQQGATDVVGLVTVNQAIDAPRGHGDYTVDFRFDGAGEAGIHCDPGAGLSATRIGSTGNPRYLVGSISGRVKALSLADAISPPDRPPARPTDPAFSPLNTSGGANPTLNGGAGNGEFPANAASARATAAQASGSPRPIRRPRQGGRARTARRGPGTGAARNRGGSSAAPTIRSPDCVTATAARTPGPECTASGRSIRGGRQSPCRAGRTNQGSVERLSNSADTDPPRYATAVRPRRRQPPQPWEPLAPALH